MVCIDSISLEKSFRSRPLKSYKTKTRSKKTSMPEEYYMCVCVCVCVCVERTLLFLRWENTSVEH